MMTVAIIMSGILILLGALHLYWVAGGKWGVEAVVPTREDATYSGSDTAKVFTPPAVATAIVALLLFAAAAVVMWRAGIFALPLPLWINRVGIWVIAALFLLRSVGEFRYVGFFKKIRTTTFARFDTLLFSPLCLILGIMAVAVAL